MVLKTPRLTLEACTPEILKSLIENRLPEAAGLRISPNWPLEEIKDALPFFLEWITAGQTTLGWGMWLMILDRCVIGGAGFVKNPDETGTVELGYSIAPEYRRNGYTFEACDALVKWALNCTDVKAVKAQCLPSNVPSIRIMNKLGMQCSEHEGITTGQLSKLESLPRTANPAS